VIIAPLSVRGAEVACPSGAGVVGWGRGGMGRESGIKKEIERASASG